MVQIGIWGIKMSNVRDIVLTDGVDTQNFVFPFGEQLSAEKRDDVLVQFQYNYLDTHYDVRPPKITGDGEVAVLDSMAHASSASVGEATLTSRDSIRYRPGHSGFVDFTFLCAGVIILSSSSITSIIIRFIRTDDPANPRDDLLGR